MLTKLTIRNFKSFKENVEVELSERAVLVGPNNSGKTSVLQALALWEIGAKRWLEKYGGESVPEKRSGVTINRYDLTVAPAHTSKQLWHNLCVREGRLVGDRVRTQNVPIEIGVEGIERGKAWACRLEFNYANEETFYCRSACKDDFWRLEVPVHLAELRMAYLPPMSGLASREDRLDMGAINVRLGEGRTAEVLRNLCWQVLQSENGDEKWRRVAKQFETLFDVRLNEPRYIKERGEVVMDYRTRDGITLDLSASGRGQQQALLLLVHLTLNPGAVLLLDEPDAHLEPSLQQKIYDILAAQAAKTDSQLIAATHSETIIKEAIRREDTVALLPGSHAELLSKTGKY